ncbi:MAG: M13 family peptidase, partial [Pseudoalteromonas prydzensis]
MKKTLIAATLAATFLAGCSKPETTETAAPKTAVEATTAPAEKPELGSFGVDLTARNEAVKPGDDFFMYASGTWY